MIFDLFQAKLQAIYVELGGDGTITPPIDITDTLNWWLSQIYEIISGDFIPKVPSDVFDDTNWWLQKIYENLSGNIVNPPPTIRDSLEWWFQQFHEFYTGESNVTVPNPVPNNDVLKWWLDIILEDIVNGGSIPWCFGLSSGELILTGNDLPISFTLNLLMGELTVDDADLPIGFSNWRSQDGRIYADEV